MVIVATVGVDGPLAEYAGGFFDWLCNKGYTLLSARSQLRLAARLSDWLAGKGRSASEVTDERAEAFMTARRRQGYCSFTSVQALDPLRRYLAAVGVEPPKVAMPTELTQLERMLLRYKEYLTRERGLTAPVVEGYRAVARTFLAGREAASVDLSSLGPQEVIRFALDQSRGAKLHQVRHVASALRSFLRYLQIQGDIVTDLAAVVPAAAGWTQASLPKFLPPKDVRLVLESCERRTATGRRDYAVLMLLARLGLRRGEVAALTLDDIDWHQGEILIRGKGNRQDRLPLPADVGTAVVAYLRRGRRRSDSRALFLNRIAPYGALASSNVTSIVGRAAIRAGLAPFGAHRLRHTAATVMLDKGASLEQIAQVLRHRHLATTAIYAKVDHRRLRELAQPWNWAMPGQPMLNALARLAELAWPWPGVTP